MHDTYWYGLVKAKSAYNKDSSHSPAMIEKIYRSMASFEDCVRVFRTLPPGTPAHLRCWVLDWLDGFVQHVRGKGVPKPGEEAAQAEPTADRLPSDVMPAETDDDHDEGEQDSDFLDLPVIPPLHTEPPRPIEEGNGLKGSENVIVLDAQPNPIAQGTTTPQSTPASLSSVHGNESPEQPTGTEANQLILAGTVPKSPDQALLPKPARLPDGRIHWKNMSEVVLDNLFSNYTAPQIAGAWGIHVTGVYVKIRKWQKSAVLAGANGMAPASGLGTKKPAPRSTIPWPASKADFLQEIWDVPATKICLRLG